MSAAIHSHRIKVGGLDIHYLCGGQGEPLLVIHGGTDGSGPWRENMRALAQRYTVYVPDLPGFGKSEPLRGDFYIPEYVDFVRSFAQRLELKSFYLMGHSLGGGIAASYALRYPQHVKKLVLVNSLCLGKGIAPWVRFFSLKPFCQTLGTGSLWLFKGVKWVAETLFAVVEYVPPVCSASVYLGSQLTNIKQQATVLVNELSHLVMPTLIIWGARDPILPVQQAYAAARLIPDCRVRVFADAGHSVYRQELVKFSAELARFLG